MSTQPRYRICGKRPPWNGKNCPASKRCYHQHISSEQRVLPAARTRRGGPEADDPETHPMVYDGYYGRFVPIEAASCREAEASEASEQRPGGGARLRTKRGR